LKTKEIIFRAAPFHPAAVFSYTLVSVAQDIHIVKEEKNFQNLSNNNAAPNKPILCK
jgi:hypothetical protein